MNENKVKAQNHSFLAAYVERPADVRFVDQEPDEKILLLLRRHPITNFPWMAVLFLLFATPFFLSLVLEGTPLDPAKLPLRVSLLLIILWYLFSLGYGVLSFLSWFFNIYLVTSRRVVDLDYFGFLFYRLSEAELSQIQDVTYEVGGVFRTLFNFGDVFIQTAAEKREFDFEAVPNPAEVHDLVTDLVEKND